uniref:MAGUK p55 subfamily member 3-like n=1 Tax=Gouania willdenowi TaxID=441366 RepID=A0A8C5DLI1_GOUWI
MPMLSANTGLHETLALLTSQLHPDANHKEDLNFLQNVFSERSIGYLMKIHEKLKQYEKLSPAPVLHSASCLAEDLAEELQCGVIEEDEQELLLLLNTPHIKAILYAHDTVAQKKFDPELPPLPNDLLDDDLEEESVKIVRLVKNKEPLGATIRRDKATGAVIVARIMRGGAADRSGLVHVGDELREVNGYLITQKRPDEISQLLSQSQGSITLKIIPAVAEEDKLKESKVFLKALFDYTPFEDKATPCQEAGLPFKRGDILQVVSQEDATWWQAKRVGDCNLRALLLSHFKEWALVLLHIMLLTFIVACLTTASLRRSLHPKKDHQGSPGETSNHTEFRIYEEVTQYLPRHGERPRLIVLIGSLGARISELKQKVIAENPRLYGLAVPHTTRARKPHEREGVEYYFISKAAFEADIQSGKFIEFGEYKENLYGTSLESIQRILNQNKVCLVDVQPEALKTLRTAEFKPYVIFIRPRIFDCQRKQNTLIRDMESHSYLLSALAELQLILEKVLMEPQWVPAWWVRR